ncbi:MAG: DUF438 domain-containing protein [Actinobacteria bacterium]|nr:MAG: DUF438 domain-containing protein [Actinomycetota bacterium]
MELTAKTTIKSLLKEHPYLLDFLIEYRPEYGKLANPVLRASLGAVATLEMVAEMGNVPLEQLMSDIRSEIERHATESPMELQAHQADQMRHEALGGMIRDLHAGVDPDVIKRRFAELIEHASPSDIAAMEQTLVAEGMPEEEIKAMCDLHVKIFQESLEMEQKPVVPGGHPVHTFHRENEALAEVAKRIEHELADIGEPPTADGLRRQSDCLKADLARLAEIEKHYLRKENELFPALEKHGVTAPPKVMWAIHDDVRALLKDVRKALEEGPAATVVKEGRVLVKTIIDMIYKEENVLFPLALETLSEGDWVRIREGEAAIGYALVEPRGAWKAFKGEVPPGERKEGHIALQTGLLTAEQIDLLFNTLPVDVSFVDENDVVRFYSEGTRIFPRSPGIIGRTVQNCHPKASVAVVQRILDAFRAGERDVAEFWIEMNERFIHIRYFALRDVEGAYKGVVELVQDATDVRRLAGERRLLDWDVESSPKGA